MRNIAGSAIVSLAILVASVVARGTPDGNVPSGAIWMIVSGTCPSGSAEVSALSGKTVIGTVAANGDVGGTGGSDTLTPTGTNSAPAFTGSAWTPPAIAWPAGVPTNAAITAGTPAGTNAASATTGNCAATNLAIGTGATTACKATAPNLTVSAQTFTGSALATHTHTVSWPAGVPTIGAYTPTGTVAAPTFTGNSGENRSAFVKVIFCSKS